MSKSSKGNMTGIEFDLIEYRGPSKNYVTSRGGEGVDDFVTYRYVYLRGKGGIL